MSVVAQILAIVEGLGVAFLGILSAFFFRSPSMRGVFLIEPENQEIVRPWAISYGFSNLAWGTGAIAGVVAVNLGFPEVGRTLVVFVSIATIVRALASSSATSAAGDWWRRWCSFRRSSSWRSRSDRGSSTTSGRFGADAARPLPSIGRRLGRMLMLSLVPRGGAVR